MFLSVNSTASVHSLKKSIHFVLVNRLRVVNYSLRASRNFKKGKFCINFYLKTMKPFVIFKLEDLAHLHNMNNNETGCNFDFDQLGATRFIVSTTNIYGKYKSSFISAEASGGNLLSCKAVR